MSVPIHREPLLHFVLLGGLAFGVYSHVHRPAPQRMAGISISAAQIRPLELRYGSETGRPPTDEERGAMREQLLDDEVLYREALAIDLDDGDVIIRRRLIQKMQFFLEDLGTGEEPRDDELEQQLKAHFQDYEEPARVSFEQRFFKLRSAVNPTSPGDPTMSGMRFTAAAESEVASRLGPELARQIFTLAPGTGFQGPFESPYGFHLVRLERHAPAQLPALAEIRARVRTDLLTERRALGTRRALQALRTKYGVPGAGTVLRLRAPVLTAEETSRPR